MSNPFTTKRDMAIFDDYAETLEFLGEEEEDNDNLRDIFGYGSYEEDE